VNTKLQSPRGQHHHNSTQLEVSETASPKIDRTVEMLLRRACEYTRHKSPSFVTDKRVVEADYVSFLGDCLETIVGHLRAQISCADASVGSEAALILPYKDHSGELREKSLCDMTLAVNSSASSINYLLYASGAERPTLIACVQDTPLPQHRRSESGSSPWRLVAVLVDGAPQLTDLSLNVPVQTSFPKIPGSKDL
jgi:hypothetical protein